jgi:hypothetical protein
MYADYNTLKGDPLNARPQLYPGFPPMGEVFRTTSGLSMGYRWVISPKVVNDFTAGFSRFQFLFTQGEVNPDWPNIPPYSFANGSDGSSSGRGGEPWLAQLPNSLHGRISGDLRSLFTATKF